MSVGLLATGGKLTIEQLDAFALLGNFYLTNEITTRGLITQDTIFTQDTFIYLIFEQEDYSGKEFLGYYECEDIILLVCNDKISLNGWDFNYTAKENGGTWKLIHSGFGSTYELVYEKSTEKIIDEDSDSEFCRINEDIYAVVTLTSDDVDLRDYCMSYKVKKGFALPTTFIFEGMVYKYAFSSYSGEIITGYTALEITSVITVNPPMSLSDIYGNFEKCFIFDIENMTAYIGTRGSEETGSFIVTDITEESVSITATFESISFDARIDIDYGAHALEIITGGLAGSYVINLKIYEGLPFVSVFETGDGWGVELYPNGYYHVYKPGSSVYGWYKVTGVTGDRYIMEYRFDDDVFEFEYDDSTQKLYFDGKEYIKYE